MADMFLPNNSAELREVFLRDLRLAAIDTGITVEPPTQPGTDWYLLAEATSRHAMIGVGNQALSDRDRSVLTATGTALDNIRKELGLPEVTASGSTGKILPTILGTTTILGGTEFVLPNGFRGRVVGTYENPVQGDELDVESIDVGSTTNLGPGVVVKFVTPPVNVATEAKVSTGSPLTGGTDVETDERKRQRILNTLQNKPAGGNWADIRQRVLDNFGAVQDCYIYPALGGPSSAKVVPVKDFDLSTNDFSRSVTSATQQSVRALIFSKLSIGNQNVIQASVDQPADFTLLVQIPASALSGGNGQGWTDQVPWPALEIADGGTVTITAVGGNDDVITVDAATTTAPISGQTHVAWWSSVDRTFYTALVIGQSGSSGAWVLTVDRPLRGKGGASPQVGDYISPGAANLGKYGTSWVNTFRALGPGQNTTDANRLPRSLRRPFVTDEDRSDITTTALTALTTKHSEITNIAFGYVPVTEPTVPGSVDTGPAILIPRRFAIYEI